ncbi:alkaline phosphatase-like protein [Westerdykella ornata]|uniref:GPI ethanolamine phosphate transferase 2 n=1 Tax=Westerdykella ornata TaxID=318751 RepID=A0A6A6JAU1_WESOR|nr:alkaline phosphatase-like protein [Westerdykella ornata]KAF2272319.1 alkaline phosphatase-like protein [Westerdykella ornata]
MAARGSLLTLANLLIPVAVLVFAAGFFPYKPFMPGLATYGPLGWEEKMGWEKEPEAQFDKLVFMVVDALRSDFVFGKDSGMKFVQSLIRDGLAVPFTAHATSPTITMPRVKAMTTGSVPSFLDVILNFLESDTTSSLAKQDTWLAQINAKEGGKLVMYGDDTWLKLFPGFFERADGTSSFFVSDFTEVDNNVTRHVPDEMLNDDWNAMIMHYLGLDHIGHKTGPKGPQMIPKQTEMDQIVKQIYDAIDNEDHLSNTLFVLCGDHGMNDGGNHGGSSPGETSPALVFMSPKMKKITEFRDRASPIEPKTHFDYYKTVEQSDIAPTLAGLLGFPIPRNNLGIFIDDFLYFWDDGMDRVRLLMQNARQMKAIVEATYPSANFKDEVQEMNCEKQLSTGEMLACKWQHVAQVMSSVASLHPQMRVDYLYNFLRNAQDAMSTTASNYDVSKLYMGTLLALVATSLSLISLRKTRTFSSAAAFYSITLLLHGISMFASSYVEEEHGFWYLMTSTWFIYLLIRDSQSEWFLWFLVHPAVMLMYLHRVIRSWNQTGQKNAGAPDIVHAFATMTFGSAVLWSFIGATYLDITTRLARHVARCIASFIEPDPDFEPTDTHRMMGTSIVLPLSATAFVFKLGFTAKDAPELTNGIAEGLVEWVNTLDLVGLARMVFAGLALTATSVILGELVRARARKGKQGGGHLAVALFDLTTLFLITQTKAQNIPLYLLFRLQTVFLSHLDLSPSAITTTTLLLSHSSFFATGNNNAISSIDLSNAYNGISGYNISLVGLLVFLSNWAAPIYWALFGVLLLGSHGHFARNFDTAELDSRDWVAKEREHLLRLATQEKERVQKREDTWTWMQHVGLMTVWTSASLAVVMAACTVLRSHLFVWSVFSPKFLMQVVWGVAFHGGVTVGLGGLIWWLVTW